jgi:outer membrane protein OmpA-like peptidoglycan-associated protein
MKKLYACLLLALLLPGAAFRAQDFMGYSMSNYAGITGVFLNPASIADSRYRFDMELVGLDFNFSNNYLGIKKEAILHPSHFSDNNFQKNYVTERQNSDKKGIYMSANLHLPSFMIRLNPKNSVGFSIRMRSYFALDGLETNLAHQIYKGLQDSVQYFQTLENKQLSIQYMSWAEYGLSYARVLKDQDKHFLKVGITLKLLQGLGAAYMYINDLHYRVSNKDTMSFFNTKLNYGHSTKLDFNSKAFSFGSNFSLGGDLGVIYEYRPDYMKYKYDMDGETNKDMRWKNKYKFRFGFSILDVGGIRYQKGPYSRDFTANINLWNIAKLNLNNTQALDDTLRKRFVMNKSDNSFYMSLPTALSLQADYGIYKDFYVGLMGNYAFQFKNSPNKIHEISRVALVPRWDHKWFGAYFPISYDGYRNFNYGLNLRLGPVIFGSNALNSYFGKSDVYGAEFHVLLKIPIPYGRVKDRDHDKVSDKKDKCPNDPGTWEFLGCPDRDGDHVPDSEDQCPDQPGTKENHGCPDRDGDGIIDKLDACPDEKGPAKYNGCPDRDGDGVIDKEDQCPDEPGSPELKGCPDRDGDGVIDKLDQCPDKPGPADNDGCPVVNLVLLDANGDVLRKVKQSKDGSFNFEAIANEANAVFAIEGLDTDALKELNLVVNGQKKKIVRGTDNKFRFEFLKADQHKLETMEEKDVPIKLTVAEAQILKKAFSNLEFETGKDVIKSESLPSLDELASLLKKKTDWKLKLSGFTDNQGKKEDNMKLSEKRAKAVAKHLTEKGVDEKRFKIAWFGPDKPIAPNTTPQGRQKNRRVEMLIID